MVDSDVSCRPTVNKRRRSMEREGWGHGAERGGSSGWSAWWRTWTRESRSWRRRRVRRSHAARPRDAPAVAAGARASTGRLRPHAALRAVVPDWSAPTVACRPARGVRGPRGRTDARLGRRPRRPSRTRLPVRPRHLERLDRRRGADGARRRWVRRACSVLGVCLHERKARTDAALASVATGIAGLFVTVTVAAQVYHARAAAAGRGPGRSASAPSPPRSQSAGSRAASRALGILGALAAPILAGVAGDGGTMVLLFVALASAAGVLLWHRWNWLALGGLHASRPRSGSHTSIDGAGALEAIAVARRIRLRSAWRWRSVMTCVSGPSDCTRLVAYLLALNAIVVAAAGGVALGWMDPAGRQGMASRALRSCTSGSASRGPRFTQISHDLGLLSLAIGAVLADVAFGLIANGPVLAIGWAATGVGLRRAGTAAEPPAADDSHGEALAHAGLGGHLALSLLSAASVGEPAEVLARAREPVDGGRGRRWRAGGQRASCPHGSPARSGFTGGSLLDVVGLAVVALLTALTLDGVQLVLVWAAEAVALGAIGHRTARRAHRPAGRSGSSHSRHSRGSRTRRPRSRS